MKTSLQKGHEAETWACQFLEKEGYLILERNYRYKKGEMDIIAQKEDWLVFVEVRARSQQSFGFAENSLSENKISWLKKVAENYILRKNWKQKVRFDIIAIQTEKTRDIQHFQDVFY